MPSRPAPEPAWNGLAVAFDSWSWKVKNDTQSSTESPAAVPRRYVASPPSQQPNSHSQMAEIRSSMDASAGAVPPVPSPPASPSVPPVPSVSLPPVPSVSLPPVPSVSPPPPVPSSSFPAPAMLSVPPPPPQASGAAPAMRAIATPAIHFGIFRIIIDSYCYDFVPWSEQSQLELLAPDPSDKPRQSRGGIPRDQALDPRACSE